MRKNLQHVGLALLVGVIAFAVFFFVGSVFNSRNDTEGMVAYCVAVFGAGFWMVRRYPKSIAYAGILISAPAWALFAGPADPGQLKSHLVGLIIGVVSAYLGSFAPKLLPQRQAANGN